MTSFIKFTPISGTKNESPYCYLLEIDQTRILLDCGTDEDFTVDHFQVLQKHAKQLDLLLLSHSSLKHIGGLPYLVSHLELACPIYATVPVSVLGKIGIQEALSAQSDFTLFNSEDIKDSFQRIIQLRYMQPITLEGRGITITPFQAGHTIGGTVWKIKKNSEDILYAVNYNHRKERHLNAFEFSKFERPSLLITDSKQALAVSIDRKKRDKDLIDSILAALRRNGNALIPVSTARVLEVAYIIDQYWIANKFPYPVYILSEKSEALLEHAKSMLEWMGETVVRCFSTNRENPFDFKYVKLCSSIEELDSKPKAILAATETLSSYSKALLAAWGENPANQIIFTCKPAKGLAREILDDISMKSISFTLTEKVKLEGQELKQFNKEQQDLKDQEQAEKALKDFMKHRDEDESDEEEEIIENTEKLKKMFWHDFHFDLFVEKENFDAPLKRTFEMFPQVEKKQRIDEYGSFIRHDDFANKELLKEQELEATRNETLLIEPKKEVLPLKLVSSEKTLKLKCRRKLLDFEGLSDGKSVKNIIEKLNPRKLILIGGNEESTEFLKQFSKSIIEQVYTPGLGECINVSSTLNIFQIKLHEKLLENLQVTEFGEYELANVFGTVKNESEVGSEAILVPKESAMPIKMLGNLKLSNLKKTLADLGFYTEFSNGALVCNQQVSISKSQNEFVIQGTNSDDFYKMRKAFYESQAIL